MMMRVMIASLASARAVVDDDVDAMMMMMMMNPSQVIMLTLEVFCLLLWAWLM